MPPRATSLKRVVTLVAEPSEDVFGVAFKISTDRWQETVAYLDIRESGGYTRLTVDIQLENGLTVDALTYVAHPNNPSYLGHAELSTMAKHIVASVGPSGPNIDYLRNLATALRTWAIPDTHIDSLMDRARVELEDAGD